MNNSFLFLRQTIRGDPASIVKSLWSIRLAVVFAIIIVALATNFIATDGVKGFRYLLISLFFVLAWTFTALVYFFYSNSERNMRYLSVGREVLIDFGWVFLVVFLSGKSANPFIYYYLVLIAITSTLLNVRQAWAFCVLAIGVYSILLYLDSAQHYDHIDAEYRTHLLGMWLNFIGAALITCFFISNLAEALKIQQSELATIREHQLKNEQLIGIGTVAASTVHALATPLSTLKLLVDDFVHNPSINADAKNDLQLMQQQINRCSETMKKLARLSDRTQTEKYQQLQQLIESLEEYYLLHSPGRLPLIEGVAADMSWRIVDDQLFSHALINIINNALESSPEPVKVYFAISSTGLEIRVINSIGIDQREMLQSWGKMTESSKLHGLGIGSLLANSTIERLGGTVELKIGKPHYRKIDVNVVIQMPADFCTNEHIMED